MRTLRRERELERERKRELDRGREPRKLEQTKSISENKSERFCEKLRFGIYKMQFQNTVSPDETTCEI